MAKKASNSTFEKDMEKLEQLVQSMEEAPIEEMVDKYTEAMKLLLKCKSTLDSYRKKIEAVTPDGKITDITEEADA